VLGQTGGIGFYALTIWAGGTILVGAGHRLLNTPDTTAMYVVAYAALGVIAVLLAVWGHASLVAANKWFVIPVSGLVMLIGFIVLADKFDTGYGGGQYLLGSFGATWWLSTVVCGGSVTLVLFVNDWTRRIDPRKWRAPSRLAIVSGGAFGGAAVALLFGAFCATLFAPGATSWGQGFAEVAPAGYLAVFAIIVALGGTMVHGTVDLYSGGLDLASLVLRLKRVPATLLISIAGQIVVVLATLVWNAQSSLTAYITLLTVACTAWAAVLITGHLAVRGRYNVDDLQVLNRRERGGVYWYRGGWNIWATVCWAVGTAVGAMFTATDWFVGPLSDAFGGVDISWILGGAIAAVMYAPVARTLAIDSIDAAQRSEAPETEKPVVSKV
jgi:purine-cytosine permease-like protein